LDENVVRLIHSLPVQKLCDLTLAPGTGDKKILRDALLLLGLSKASGLQKRAMQFGTRIANKRVAGYVHMDASVRLVDIVNPNFLDEAHRPPTAVLLCKRKNKQRRKVTGQDI